jgi:hypothetical protein
MCNETQTITLLSSDDDVALIFVHLFVNDVDPFRHRYRMAGASYVL